MTLKAWTLLFICMAAAAGLRAQVQSEDEGLPRCVAAAKWSGGAIRGDELWSAGGPGGAFVAVKTNAGHYALLSLSALDTLVLESAQLFDASGALLFEKEYLRIPGGSSFDVDTGKAAADNTADVRWNTSGGKRLEPVNAAAIYRCQV